MESNTIIRTFKSAFYLINNNSTIRETAKAMGVSKSTTHVDLSRRLYLLDPRLYVKVQHVIEENKANRHIKGGKATKNKFK